MRRNKYTFQILTISFLIFCTAFNAAAQRVNADQNVLAKFEKSIEQSDYAAVENDLLKYAIANPKDAKAFDLLGRLRFGQTRFGEAKSLFQKALSLDPNLTSAKINLAVVNFQTGNVEQSAALNEITDADVTNDALRLKLATAFVLVGDCQKALLAAEKLAAKIKNNDALPLLAECYLQTGEKSKIDSLVISAKNLARQNPATAMKFAEVLISGAMHGEAAEVLRVVIAIAPSNADALLLLAKSEIYAKDFPNAKIHLSRTAKINPNSPDLFFVQSLLESEQGNYSQSLDLLGKSLAAKPDSPEVLKQFVITAMRANQAGKAARAAERLLELNPNEPEFLYLHGAASLQSNNLPAAETSLNRFVEMRPQDSRGCLALGLTYAAQSDKLTEARRELEHCLEINARNFEASYQLGLSYKAQGENVRAIEYLEETIKNAPDYALALRELGALYLQSNQEIKAAPLLEKAAAINPNDADTQFQLSRLYNLTGQADLAKKHLELFQKLKNSTKNGM